MPSEGRLVVRVEGEPDHAAVRDVVREAFGSTTEADLVEAIRASPEFLADLALVAELDGAVVGSVVVSVATLESASGPLRIANLSPLAVTPAVQGRGIGAGLVRDVVRRADEAGEPMIVVEGDPRYYGRFGFEPAARYGITMPLPDWAPPEAAQVVLLGRSGTPPAGRVVYPPAFAAVLQR